MTETNQTVPCRYCGKQTEHEGTRKCNLCWVVELNVDEFVRSNYGLVRTLLAISKRPPLPAGALPLTEAIALGTSGQAGNTGQLLAAELLVLQSTVERVRLALSEIKLMRDNSAPLSESRAFASKIVGRLRAALGEP